MIVFADEDARNPDRRVVAERDAYVAGHDINLYGSPASVTSRGGRTLAQVVLRQAQEKRSLLVGADVPGDETANVGYARIPGRLREAGGREVGDLRSVLEYYQSLSPRRLVVLGAPGAGKTVLLLELQIRILEEQRGNPAAQIPVLISASAYDTAKNWEDWLAAQISLQFSIPERTAAELIARGRILPMVDGLDEMDPARGGDPERAQALVRALNQSMRGLDRAPVVVSCRHREYGRLVEGVDKARHVELSGLTGGEASAYLRSQFRTVVERDRWTPVLDALEREPEGALAAELATPWRLTLALATFRGGGDPAWLLPLGGITGRNYSAHVDRMLLDGYVPSAVSLYQGTASYTEPKVRRWLTSLADGLVRQSRHGRSATDITLHEWGRKPRENWAAQVPYAVLVLLPALVCMIAGTCMRDTLVAEPTGILAICALGASRTVFPPRRGSRQIANRPRGAAWFRFAVATGIAAGLAAGLAAWFMFGLQEGFLVGLRSGSIYGLAFGLAAGFTTGIAYGPVYGRMPRFAAGAVAMLACGFMFGLATGLAGVLSVLLSPSLPANSARLMSVLTGELPVMLWSGATVGPLIGLMNGLTDGLTNISPRTRRPQTLIRANGLAGLAGWLAGGLAGVLVAAVAIAPVFGFAGLSAAEWLAYALVYGFTFGVAITARTWIRYHLFVVWNACRGRGPLRFGKFLDWAVEAGLLRESGVSYQFRHRQLQDWLTPTSSRLRYEPDTYDPETEPTLPH